jgi:hypothetical protein
MKNPSVKWKEHGFTTRVFLFTMRGAQEVGGTIASMRG